MEKNFNLAKLVHFFPTLMVFYHLFGFLSLVYLFAYGHLLHFIFLFIFHFIHVSLASSAMYHRYLAHKSWAPPRWFEYFTTILAITGCYGSSIAWASTHREHHKFSDNEKDPHSPHIHSVLYVFFGVFYRPVNIKLVTDLMRDKFHIFVHKHYFKILFGLPLFAFIFLDPLWAIVITVGQGSLAYFTAGGLLNTICHKFGYRNYETKDYSTNNFWLGYLLYGEGWHNNHHYSSHLANFSSKNWWEFDLTYKIICLLNSK